jgi:hypothetical protein
VAMSFLRAHAGLLDERYGLYIDPRVRHPQDWALSLAPIETPITGSSVGASITSMLWATHGGIRTFSKKVRIIKVLGMCDS